MNLFSYCNRICFFLGFCLCLSFSACSDEKEIVIEKEIAGVISVNALTCKWNVNGDLLNIELNSKSQDSPACIVFIDKERICNTDTYPYQCKTPIMSGNHNIEIAYSYFYQKIGFETDYKITLDPTSSKWINDEIIVP